MVASGADKSYRVDLRLTELQLGRPEDTIMAIGDVWQLVVRGSLQGQTIEHVLHYAVSANTTQAALSTGLFNWASATLIPALSQLQSNDFLWTTVIRQKIWPLPNSFPDISTVSVPGVETASAMPSEVCMTVTKKTIFAGRSYRGRIYVAGLPNNWLNVTTGKWNATAMSSAVNTEDALDDVVPSSPVGGTLQPVIYHRGLHGFDEIVAAQARDIPRSQRRRQIGRGV